MRRRIVIFHYDNTGSSYKMKISYDPDKKAKTLRERGLDFDDASIVLNGEIYEFEDARQDYGEKRMIVVGFLAKRMIIIGYVQRANIKHIFSMRKANEREEKKYQERFKKE